MSLGGFGKATSGDAIFVREDFARTHRMHEIEHRCDARVRRVQRLWLQHIPGNDFGLRTDSRLQELRSPLATMLQYLPNNVIVQHDLSVAELSA